MLAHQLVENILFEKHGRYFLLIRMVRSADLLFSMLVEGGSPPSAEVRATLPRGSRVGGADVRADLD